MANSKTKNLRADVLIVGGGLAGITAAIGLRNSGLSVILVEKERVLGGRAQSWTDKTTGDTIHNGPHIVLNKYPNMFKLLEMLGTRDRIAWQPEGSFITMVDGRQEIEMSSDPRLPAPFHFLKGVLNDKNLSMSDVLSMTPVTMYVLQLTQKDILKLDNVNASTFLRSFGVSEHMIEYYLSFICTAILNVPIELCSAGALVRFYAMILGVPELSIGFPTCGLSDLYVPQAQKLMRESGIQVLKNTAVQRFLPDRSNPQRIAGVELADGRTVRADRVIAALTPAALRRMLPPEWIRSYQIFHELVHFQACPYFSTYLWFDKKLTDKAFWARVHNPNDLNCDFYDLANIYPEIKGGGSLITTNCIYSHRAEHMSDEEIIEVTRQELAEYLPAATRASMTHAVVNRIPMAIHCPYPGMEQRRPPTVTPVAGLYLAGDWIGTGLPSCMENACMSGWLAAEEVLEAYGKREDLAIDLGFGDMQGLTRIINTLGHLMPISPLTSWLGTKSNPKKKFLGHSRETRV